MIFGIIKYYIVVLFILTLYKGTLFTILYIQYKKEEEEDIWSFHVIKEWFKENYSLSFPCFPQWHYSPIVSIAIQTLTFQLLVIHASI